MNNSNITILKCIADEVLACCDKLHWFRLLELCLDLCNRVTLQCFVGWGGGKEKRERERERERGSKRKEKNKRRKMLKDLK